MNSFSIRTKILALGIILPLVLVSLLFGLFYFHSESTALNAFIDKARAICLTAESTREEMEDKWAQGLFSRGQLRQWMQNGEQQKIIAAVPVVSAWQAAMKKSEEGEYTFRTPKFQPRNPANQPDPLEARALEAFQQGVSEYYEIDEAQNAVRYFRPVVLSQTCMNCHGDPTDSQEYWGNDQGLDPTGARMENWEVGEVHGAFEVIQSLDSAQAMVAGAMFKGGMTVLAGMAIYILLFVFFISRTFIQPLNRTVAMISGLEKGDLDHRLQMERKDEIGILAGSLDRFADNLKHEVLTAFQRLADGDFTFKAQGLIAAPLTRANTSLNQLVSELQQVGERINGRSAEVADSSQALSQGATEQAASLEEISASLHELTSQTKKNADNAGLADRLTGQVQGSAQNGNQQMQQMVAAMADINDSGQNISKIIKVIDEIAFQTNLLALNAAVEAARAGVHGKGFAVVAEEVRNLAGRSAKAAQETAELIEGSLAKAKNGAEIAEHTAKALKEIVQGIGKITDLAGEIATASNEQAEGIDQINIGISQIDQVTQQNTATAEESAAAAEDLSGQAVRLHTMLSRFKLESSRILAPPPTATPAQRPSYSPEKSAAAQKREPAKKEEWGTSGPSSSPPEMIALDDDEFGRY